MKGYSMVIFFLAGQMTRTSVQADARKNCMNNPSGSPNRMNSQRNFDRNQRQASLLYSEPPSFKQIEVQDNVLAMSIGERKRSTKELRTKGLKNKIRPNVLELPNSPSNIHTNPVGMLKNDNGMVPKPETVESVLSRSRRSFQTTHDSKKSTTSVIKNPSFSLRSPMLKDQQESSLFNAKYQLGALIRSRRNPQVPNIPQAPPGLPQTPPVPEVPEGLPKIPEAPMPPPMG